ncbi:MAG: 2-isopropylmalate synthase, partial [Firmicutes bacterium]|nr:2-isopropylmalate synthase [Bacillota bacterium]
GIAYWINDHYGLKGIDMMSKDSPIVAELKEWVDEMYADGRTTALANIELEAKIDELTGGKLK